MAYENWSSTCHFQICSGQKYFRNLRLGPGLGAKYKVTKLPAAVLVHISHMWPRLRITCYAGYNAWGSLACGRDLRCLSECAVRCARAPAHGDGTLYMPCTCTFARIFIFMNWINSTTDDGYIMKSPYKYSKHSILGRTPIKINWGMQESLLERDEVNITKQIIDSKRIIFHIYH